MDSAKALNLSPTCTRLAKADKMRQKEERKWLQNSKKFKHFREKVARGECDGEIEFLEQRLLQAGIFGKDRPKHLIVADKTCGGKRRVPVLELLDQNPLYARRQKLNSGMHVIDKDGFSDTSTEVSDVGSDAASGSSLSEASLPGSIPDNEEHRVLALPTIVRKRRHFEPSIIGSWLRFIKVFCLEIAPSKNDASWKFQVLNWIIVLPPMRRLVFRLMVLLLLSPP